jgi:RNA polymerase sigma-70 factor (ECF subfamily)
LGVAFFGKSVDTPAMNDAPGDGVIIAAVLAGKRERFAELVQRYQRPLLRVAFSRLGRPDWSEDVVQETFLCALKWIRTYDSRFSFRTWLWTILLNQCHRHWKKHSRGVLVGNWAELDDRHSLYAELVRRLASDDGPAEEAAAREQSRLLDALLLRLPEAQADALRLRFFGGLTFPEIAAAMGCSLSTAKNRVKWGLTKLAEFLGPAGEFVSHSPGGRGENE